jgi:ParB-like chromosome segregation protein Spo0J
MNDYLEADDTRRWEDDLINAGLLHDDQSAFALGQDVARIAEASHLAIIDRFLVAVSDEASSSNARFARCFGQRDATDVVASRLQAFQMGLQRKP